jgi:hypothetical protein
MFDGIEDHFGGSNKLIWWIVSAIFCFGMIVGSFFF